MKQEFDQGTPELLAHKAQAATAFSEALDAKPEDATKIGGLRYLRARQTITKEHFDKGRMFANWMQNYHNKHNIRCSLATMVISEGEDEGPSEYQDFLNSIMDKAQWFSEVSKRLHEIGCKGKRKYPYGRIVLMVSCYGWSLQDVAREGAKYRKDGNPISAKTAAAWTAKAFQWLCDIIAEIENEHKRKNKL